MAALQTVAFGAASDGSQGDSVRTAFTKDNANVAVLQTQAALTTYASTITTAQALTSVHTGDRVNINLATAGTVNLPSAATCVADSVILLRNIGTTVVTLAITAGSGDTVALSKLNAGESALVDTDGVHTWRCLMRGRTNADNEVVNGTLTVGSTLAATGAISSSGAITAGGTVTTGGTLATASTQVFTVGGTERARIDSSGGVHVNETTGWIAAPLSVRASSAATSWAVSSYGAYQSGGGCYLGRVEAPATGFAGWYFGATQCGSITTSTGASTSYNTTSDYRLKENYAPIQDAAASLARIPFYQGEFKSAPGHSAQYVIAHELQEILPSAVTGEKDAVGDWFPVYREGYDPENVQPDDIVSMEQEIIPQSVDYSKLVPLLGAALQEALTRIAALESKVSA